MPPSTKKKREYWLVADEYLQIVLVEDDSGGLFESENDAKNLLSRCQLYSKDTKFNVMRITLSADTAKWK